MSESARSARPVAVAAELLAQHLAVPEPLSAELRWRAQSLTKGAAGIALLHIERAHAGVGSWRTAHAWVSAAAGTGISAADDAGLHFGAPALSFVLHAAGTDRTGRYGPALAILDPHVAALTHRRVNLAQARIGRGDLPVFAEYDLLHGLTGVGAHLLHHAPGGDALGRVLAYLVRLTRPLRTDGGTRPGWWVCHDPHRAWSPGGHANLGLAHGISGPLALLAQALRRGITVDGHTEAIGTICTWLDTWRHDADSGPWWPRWITPDQVRTGRAHQPCPLRPSWCYGTPGLARAQQLAAIAAIATRDTARQQIAEHALVGCLSDPVQLGRISDPSLCHGWAGVFQIAWRAARDALTPQLCTSLPRLTDVLTRLGRPGQGESLGLLEGDAGLALALHTAVHTEPPISGWDACLLIN